MLRRVSRSSELDLGKKKKSDIFLTCFIEHFANVSDFHDLTLLSIGRKHNK